MAETSTVGISIYESNKDVPIQMYEDHFRSVIEAHVPYLSNHEETERKLISDYLEYIKRFDFYGLLRAMGVKEACFFPALRMNGLTSITDDISHLEYLLIPSENEVFRIYQNEMTRGRR